MTTMVTGVLVTGQGSAFGIRLATRCTSICELCTFPRSCGFGVDWVRPVLSRILREDRVISIQLHGSLLADGSEVRGDICIRKG